MHSVLRCSMSIRNALTSYEVSLWNSGWTLVLTKLIDLSSGFMQITRCLLGVNVGPYLCPASVVWNIARAAMDGWMGQVNIPVTHPHRKSTHLLTSSRLNSFLAIISAGLPAGSPHSQLPGCSTGKLCKQKANLTFSLGLSIASVKQLRCNHRITVGMFVNGSWPRKLILVSGIITKEHINGWILMSWWGWPGGLLMQELGVVKARSSLWSFWEKSCVRGSLNNSDQTPKIKLRVTRKFREAVMEECFSIFTFGFISFTLFRVKHNCIKDFWKVSLSLASNAAFLNHMLQLLLF